MQIRQRSDEKNYKIPSCVSTRGAFRTSLLLLGLMLSVSAAQAQGPTTSFTYQGRLTDGGAPANNNYDLRFTLWDSALGGMQQPQPAPAPLTKTNVAVTGGVFSVLLDFGVSAFPGADRFLEVGVRPTGNPDAAFTILSPRQQISSTPYAIRTISAASADSLSNACVGCVTDSQIASVAASKVTGTLPGSSLPTDSTSYIQNRTTPQTNSNFNVSGNGIIGGNVAIGATNPTSKLDVRGNLTLDTGTNPILFTTSSNLQLNRYLQLANSAATPIPTGLKTGGLLVSDSFSYANPGKNDLVVKGNAGIGITQPRAKLHVTWNTLVGGFNYENMILAESDVGTAVTGTSGDGNGVEGTSTEGIGVKGTNRSHDGVGIFGVNTKGSGIGVRGLATGSEVGGRGVSGEAKGSLGIGVYGEGSAYAMYAKGNVAQDPKAGGWIKAMALVDFRGIIARCYNSTILGDAAAIPPCGFQVSRADQGLYVIDFGFRVRERFVSITPLATLVVPPSFPFRPFPSFVPPGDTNNVGAEFDFWDNHSLAVKTWAEKRFGGGNGFLDARDANFMIVIY